VSEDEAAATLLSNLDGKPLADPRLIKFNTGMRKKAWNKNVIAVGLSSGFLEPLESTSIHLIQAAVAQLIEFFPDKGFSQLDIDTYNAQSRFQFERIRDFIILHYHVNQRTDSEFWKACAHMAIPESLQEKIALYQTHGRIFRFNEELFSQVGWLQVMEGQNLKPSRYNPLVDLQEEGSIQEYLESVRNVIAKCVDFMPDHADYIAKKINRKELTDKFRENLIDFEKGSGQIAFTTFHQSMSYEDFVEGIKPLPPQPNESLKYEIQAGIFKIACATSSGSRQISFVDISIIGVRVLTGLINPNVVLVSLKYSQAPCHTLYSAALLAAYKI
jgi:hypothetical protein